MDSQIQVIHRIIEKVNNKLQLKDLKINKANDQLVQMIYQNKNPKKLPIDIIRQQVNRLYSYQQYRKQGYDRQKILIDANYVLNNYNFRDITNLSDYCENNGIKINILTLQQREYKDILFSAALEDNFSIPAMAGIEKKIEISYYCNVKLSSKSKPSLITLDNMIDIDMVRNQLSREYYKQIEDIIVEQEQIIVEDIKQEDQFNILNNENIEAPEKSDSLQISKRIPFLKQFKNFFKEQSNISIYNKQQKEQYAMQLHKQQKLLQDNKKELKQLKQQVQQCKQQKDFDGRKDKERYETYNQNITGLQTQIQQKKDLLPSLYKELDKIKDVNIQQIKTQDVNNYVDQLPSLNNSQVEQLKKLQMYLETQYILFLGKAQQQEQRNNVNRFQYIAGNVYKDKTFIIKIGTSQNTKRAEDYHGKYLEKIAIGNLDLDLYSYFISGSVDKTEKYMKDKSEKIPELINIIGDDRTEFYICSPSALDKLMRHYQSIYNANKLINQNQSQQLAIEQEKTAQIKIQEQTKIELKKIEEQTKKKEYQTEQLKLLRQDYEDGIYTKEQYIEERKKILQ